MTMHDQSCRFDLTFTLARLLRARSGEGLAGEEAGQRLVRYGSNVLKPQARSNALTLLLGQFRSPIVLLLLFATGLSFFLHDPVTLSSFLP